MNFLKHFFSYDFLLYINRVRLERVDKLFLVLAVLSVVAALVVRARARYERHAVRKDLQLRVWRLYLTFGLLGLVWFFFRYELIQWFGTHAAYLILVLAAVVWKLRIARYWYVRYDLDKAAWERKQLKDKYLHMHQ